MGLFNKKEPVPEIPTAPGLPELPKIDKASESEKKDLPELPSFPANPKNESLNQEIVKSAVSDSVVPDSEDLEDLEDLGGSAIPEIPEIGETQEPSLMKESPSAPPALAFPTPASKPPLTEPAPLISPVTPTPAERSNEPIFVRIDKFQESQKDFNDIRDNITEIESVLQKLKEVKLKEEEELKGWTEDVEKIKLKLGVIDADIFSQI